jgi:hypothetical protein
MPLRLIDPTHTKAIELEGVTFHIRTLNAAEKTSMGLHFRPTENGGFTGDFVRVLPYMVAGIVKIEGLDDEQSDLSTSEILNRIENADTLTRLAMELLTFSLLSESESKNLNSSPGTSPAEPPGNKT